jgi:hypothetical protein
VNLRFQGSTYLTVAIAGPFLQIRFPLLPRFNFTEFGHKVRLKNGKYNINQEKRNQKESAFRICEFFIHYDKDHGQKHFSKCKPHDKTGKGVLIFADCRPDCEKIHPGTQQDKKSEADNGKEKRGGQHPEKTQEEQDTQQTQSDYSQLEVKTVAIHS